MVFEFNSLINLIVTIAIFAVLIAIILFIYEVLKKEREFQNKEKDTLGKYNDILQKAHNHAKSILYETTVAAGNILIDSRKTNEKIEENLDHVFQQVAARDIHSVKQVSAEYEKEYRDHLETIQVNMEEVTKGALNDLEAKYKEQIDKFTSDLLANGILAQQEVGQKTAAIMTKAESEIEAYKKLKLEKIDQDAEKLLKRVYRDVLRMSIPQNVHQDLIIKALDDAKKDGILNNF